jgi:hypothetical protein
VVAATVAVEAARAAALQAAAVLAAVAREAALEAWGMAAAAVAREVAAAPVGPHEAGPVGSWAAVPPVAKAGTGLADARRRLPHPVHG